MKLKIYLCDPEYFNRYTVSRLSSPLNLGYIASYALKLYGQECDITFYKDASKLIERVKAEPPHILGLSCYHWNRNIGGLIAQHVKQIHPECVTVVGGRNVDTDLEVQLDLHKAYNKSADILVVNEGELGFANIVGRYLGDGLKHLYDQPIDGCTFFEDGDVPIVGRNIGLSLGLDQLPSPMTTGLIDEFMNPRFLPMLQTSRMCPYSCTYCCSGKLKGKIRCFPLDVVKAEIDYLAKKYYPDGVHTSIFLTDENFGLLERDLEIAEYLVKTSRDKGYPKQIYGYFDKKFDARMKKIALLLGDMNWAGVTLPLQSCNRRTLEAVKRKNLPDEKIREVINWTKENNLDIYTELITGLPYETKKSFLNGIEYLVSIGINMIVIYQLIMLMGSEINRKTERKRYGLVTKFRPASEPQYDVIDGEFVGETEEIAVSSSHFTFGDYMDVRKISLLFWAVFNVGYFRQLFDYLINRKRKIIPIFERIMTLSETLDNVVGYGKYVDDFLNAATSELCDMEHEIIEKIRETFIKNDRRVDRPTRLNPWFASRLIYLEKWFGPVVYNLLLSDEELKPDNRILQDLIAISENEWVSFSDLDMNKSIPICEDTVDFLGIEKPVGGADQYILKLSASDKQKEIISSYLRSYSAEDMPSLYYNAITYILPRKTLKI